MIEALNHLEDLKGEIRFVHQTGKNDLETVRKAYEFLGKCWESLELAMRLPGTHLSQGEQEVIDDIIKQRAQALAHAGTEYLTVRDRRENLERLLQDGEAYFTRAEFVRFLWWVRGLVSAIASTRPRTAGAIRSSRVLAKPRTKPRSRSMPA